MYGVYAVQLIAMVEAKHSNDSLGFFKFETDVARAGQSSSFGLQLENSKHYSPLVGIQSFERKIITG